MEGCSINIINPRKEALIMMLRKSFTVLLAMVFAVGMVSAAYAGTLDDILQRGELRVAVQTQGPPFSFVDKHGNRTGSSVEFCQLMAQEMGVKVKFLDYDWDGLIPALLSKKADILAADMTAKLKRALKVSFTKPFYTTGQVMYVKAGSSIKTVADANKPDITVATLLGSTYTDTARKQLPKATIKLWVRTNDFLPVRIGYIFDQQTTNIKPAIRRCDIFSMLGSPVTARFR